LNQWRSAAFSIFCLIEMIAELNVIRRTSFFFDFLFTQILSWTSKNLLYLW